MIEVDFDDSRNKPILPVLVMHPKLAKKAMEQEAQMTEEEKMDVPEQAHEKGHQEGYKKGHEEGLVDAFYE